MLFCLLLFYGVLIQASLDSIHGPREHPIVETFGYDLSSNISEIDRQLWDAVLQVWHRLGCAAIDCNHQYIVSGGSESSKYIQPYNKRRRP